MARENKDWLTAFCDHCSHTEAPRIMHFWAGVGAIAGALRRKVWIDMKAFRWSPNFYIIFVAPPGIVSKSTTAGLSMDLLREVPGINFGPDVVTWPALVTALAKSCESFQYGEEWMPMSALTLQASELGNLINPQDREMINLYIDLWDGRKQLEKVTKTSGQDMVEAPWVNILGCTTPHWIADNMPAAAVGGGFTSRCVFVYAEKKERRRAYPDEFVPEGFDEKRASLIRDLEHISLNLCGNYIITEEARAWGRQWYDKIWDKRPSHLEDDRLDGYVARKQTHMHKLAMVLAASTRDELVVERTDLELAEIMLTAVEHDLDKVFSRIGKSEAAMQTERLIAYVARRGTVLYEEAYRMIHSHFPDFKDFEGVLTGAIRAGYLLYSQKGDRHYLEYVKSKANNNLPNGNT